MRKRFLASLISLFLLLPAFLWAKPVPYNLGEHTKVNSGLHSLILPGWGQVFNGQETKGYVLGGFTAAALLSTVYFYLRSEQTYTDYQNRGVKNDALYSDYQTQANQATVASLLTAGLWLYGVVDAYVNGEDNNPSAEASEGFRFVCGRDDLSLAYSTRF